MPTSEEVLKAWDNYMTPDVMQRRMLGASVYITTFEVLKAVVVGHPLDFFSLGECDADGQPVRTARYKSEVLRFNKNDQAMASLLWWKKAGAIDDEDIDAFRAARKRRNKVVHEMATVLNEAWLDDITEHFVVMRNLLRRMEQWWVVEIEIPTDPAFDGADVVREDIIAGSVMNVELLYQSVYEADALNELRADVKAMLDGASP